MNFVTKEYERIKFQIVKVTRKGRVYVKLRPKTKLMNIPLKLNNITVNFYMERFETDVNI